MKKYITDITKFLLVGLISAMALLTACSDDDKEPTYVGPKAESVSPIEGLRPNDLVTIKGELLDLVRSVRFGERVLVESANFVEQSAGQIVVEVPYNAPSGELNLVSSVDTHPNFLAANLLMTKPIISSVKPTQVVTGDVVTVEGSDLDLVTEVTIGTKTVERVVHLESGALEVTTPTDLEMGGVLTLIMANGEEVAHSEPISLVDAYYLPEITSIVPKSGRAGQPITINGNYLSWVNMVSLATEPLTEIVEFELQSDEQIKFTLPEELPLGNLAATLHTTMGDQVEFGIFILGGTDPVEDPELLIFDFEDGLADESWDGLGCKSEDDGVSGAFYEITAATWKDGAYWMINDNWRGGYPVVSPKSDYVVKADIRLREDIPFDNAEMRILLAGVEVNILPYLKNSDETLWTTGGEWITITIALSEWGGLGDPTPSEGGEWGMTMWNNGVNFTGFCIDNVRYEKK